MLGEVLSNIFVGNMGSEIQGTLSKFATDTRLCRAVDTLEGRDVTQRDRLGLHCSPVVYSPNSYRHLPTRLSSDAVAFRWVTRGRQILFRQSRLQLFSWAVSAHCWLISNFSSTDIPRSFSAGLVTTHSSPSLY